MAGKACHVLGFATRIGLIPVLGRVISDERQLMKFYQGPIYRILSALFGLALVFLGLYVLLGLGQLDALRFAGAVALVLLGGNMAYSATRGRESWISKIGPLP